jgi:hypothetical protein
MNLWLSRIETFCYLNRVDSEDPLSDLVTKQKHLEADICP